jgi:hypothetical protein
MTNLVVYKELAGVVQAAADAMVALVDSVKHAVSAGSEGYGHIVAAKHRKHLVDLSARATDLRYFHQGLAARSIDEYLANPMPWQWPNLRRDLGKVLELLRDLLGEIQRERSDFILESAYGVMLESFGARAKLLGQMIELEPPTSPEELETLGQINSEYKRMLAAFSEAINALNEHLKEQ